MEVGASSVMGKQNGYSSSSLLGTGKVILGIIFRWVNVNGFGAVCGVGFAFVVWDGIRRVQCLFGVIRHYTDNFIN